jgi:hypothetical protein
MGSMTGRQAGYCSGYRTQIYGRPCFGRGRGFGRGWGYDRLANSYREPYSYNDINRFAAPTVQENEQQFLQQEAAALQRHLDEIRKRLDVLENQETQS